MVSNTEVTSRSSSKSALKVSKMATQDESSNKTASTVGFSVGGFALVAVIVLAIAVVTLQRRKKDNFRPKQLDDDDDELSDEEDNITVPSQQSVDMVGPEFDEDEDARYQEELRYEEERQRRRIHRLKQQDKRRRDLARSLREPELHRVSTEEVGGERWCEL